MFETVLLPVHESRETVETASKALELACIHQSQLIVLSVTQSEEQEMNDADSFKSLLNRIKEQVQHTGITCEVIKRQGNPAFVICDVADELNVDVIIMGTRSVTLDGENKSTAARVIQLAPCPVLVIP